MSNRFLDHLFRVSCIFFFFVDFFLPLEWRLDEIYLSRDQIFWRIINSLWTSSSIDELTRISRFRLTDCELRLHLAEWNFKRLPYTSAIVPHRRMLLFTSAFSWNSTYFLFRLCPRGEKKTAIMCHKEVFCRLGYFRLFQPLDNSRSRISLIQYRKFSPLTGLRFSQLIKRR